MRSGISWPNSGSRRLGVGMAEESPRRTPTRVSTRGAWTQEQIAESLVRERDALVDRLPRELAAARGMTRDQCEYVIDEAIDFMVTEYSRPITDQHALKRAFWASASYRVKRVHEGRGATVRAGWKRLDVDGVHVAASGPDPATLAIRQVEVGVLLEFAAGLTELQRQVLACKWGGEHEIGRRVIARELGIPATDVRTAERMIERKLKRFVAILAAGTLCEHRSKAISDLAVGSADATQAIVARIHLRHCSNCRVGYVEMLRELRSGALQHRIAQLLPITITADEARRARGSGPWEAITDLLSRPFASESATSGSQLLVGMRGLGAAATAKLATLCIGGAVAVGGGAYCVTELIADEPPAVRKAAKPPSDSQPQVLAPGPDEIARISARSPVLRIEPKQRRVKHAARRTSDSGAAATRHERTAAVSPPITTSAGAPVEEFGPGPEQTSASAPAAAPASGAPEFP